MDTRPIPSPADDPRVIAPVRAFLGGEPKKLLIGDKWLPAASGQTLETINPATEQVIARFAAGDRADVDAAVKAARKALENPNWADIRPQERARHLLKIAQVIDAHREELAQIESLNNGMPISFSRLLVDSVVEVFEYYAGWCTKLFGETNPGPAGVFNYTLREPIGVCGQIIPWNGPLSSASWKLAPALACGNVSILKPAEQTPLSSVRLGELILEVGLPPGVVNIITGLGETAGAAISAHPDIDKVAFTGSTEVGKMVLAASTGNLKRVTLELGGKSPNIIFADAPLDQAIAASTGGFCFLSGQICVAGSRIFAQRAIYDEVVERLTQFTNNFKVGDPFEPATMLGPLVSKPQFDRVRSYLKIGADEGARLQFGGTVDRTPGYFVSPALFTDVTNDMRIAQEEVFGPVATVIPFDDENDAVLQGNRTIFGLAAAVWTRDLSRAHRVSRALKAGTVWVNTYLRTDPISPFGGFKQSGIGRELGPHSLEAYTQIKSVFIDTNV